MSKLNQDDFKNEIIEDLGYTKNKRGRNILMVKLKCFDCEEEIIKIAANYKKKGEARCKTCQNIKASRDRLKKLNQDDYKMKIIDQTISEKSSGHRLVVFECSTCKKHVKMISDMPWSKTATECKECKSKLNGLYTHPLYAIWNGIKQRCYNPKRKDYDRYGGKGVTVSDEWRNDFLSFYKWAMDNGWKKSLVLDKDIICEQKGIIPHIYSSETCCIVTQSRNCIESNGRDIIQMSLCGDFIREWGSAKEASLVFGAKTGDRITSCCSKNTTSDTVYGYRWKYKEEKQ